MHALPPINVPAGAWAVGVSGGADSIALLHLLRQKTDLQLFVVHLNHQTRGEESDGDAKFVGELCEKLEVPCHIESRAELEPRVNDLPANPSARYRRLRFALFKEVSQAKNLAGVILAHHADDQAETVLQRLLRGAGYSSLAGMSERAVVNDVVVCRPLLNVRRAALRSFLTENNFQWREDSSNHSPKYLRNRLRAILSDDLTDRLLDLSRACAAIKDWAKNQSPKFSQEFRTSELADLPPILARVSAGRWLGARGVPADEIDRAVVDRLIEMCADAASSNRRQFPGGITVRRSRGKISASS